MIKISGVVDPWFLGRYGVNLYRGCQLGCLYCEGRAEKYRPGEDFDNDIVVKKNAVHILGKELDRVVEPGYLFLGGGVTDSYQPAEVKYGLARGVLEQALARGLPVHVLTKSEIVRRDLDVLAAIQRSSQAILAFSIQTTDEKVREHFEPSTAPLRTRFEILYEAKKRGISTGIMAMPVLPGISDGERAIDRLFAKAARIGVDFVLSGGLALRPGIQADTYMEAVERFDPELVPGYRRLYRGWPSSGMGNERYYAKLAQRFRQASERYGLPGRIPRRLFHRRIPLYAEIAILLEHEAFNRMNTGRNAAGLEESGWAIQKWARARFGKQPWLKRIDVQSIEKEFHSMMVTGAIKNLQHFTEDAYNVAIRDMSAPGWS